MSRFTRLAAVAAVITPLAAVLLAGPASAHTVCPRTLLCAPVDAPLVDVDGPLLTSPLVTGVSVTGDAK